MRLLGIDFGTKNIGLAITDEDQTIANSWKTIHYPKNNYEYAINQLKKLIQDYEIEYIVLGYPLHFSGKKSKSCDLVLNFKQKLEAMIGLKVVLHDERFSTSHTRETLKEDMGFKNNQIDKIVDKMAAQYILNDYLINHKNK